MDSTKRKLILETAEVLLKENGTLTTLDLKEELRNLYPDLRWYQEDISYTMMEAADKDGINGKDLAYHDNKQYRVYAFRLSSGSGSKKLVTRTFLARLLRDSKDQELTVQFYKKDDSLRTIVGKIGDQNALGYYEIIETNGDGNPRLIDPRRVKLVEVAGSRLSLTKNRYQLKGD